MPATLSLTNLTGIGLMAEDSNHKSEKRTPSFLERLAEKIGATATSKSVYGEPVEHAGVTIIPVAKVRYGFGGGSGKKSTKEGEGGGGGLQASPMGYIEMKDGETQFRPIRDPMAILPVVAAGGFFGWLLLRGLRKLVRRK
jgi:uncharacterized spore protein YtfJ